jgi:PqqD family protein of HPr-rel-A system
LTRTVTERLLARGDLAVAEIDGEAVVFDPLARELHYLNHSAALVFKLCDGQATVSELVADLADAYELDPAEMEEQIAPLIESLADTGLLAGPAADEIARDAAAAAQAPPRRVPVARDT